MHTIPWPEEGVGWPVSECDEHGNSDHRARKLCQSRNPGRAHLDFRVSPDLILRRSTNAPHCLIFNSRTEPSMRDKARDVFDTSKHAAREGVRPDTLSRRNVLIAGTSVATLSALGVVSSPGEMRAQQQPATSSGRKPNILVIFGDDVGQANVSAYTLGVMGFRTPNIDRVAREGMIFTDYYANRAVRPGAHLLSRARLHCALVSPR
jgi:hypothetical protein